MFWVVTFGVVVDWCVCFVDSVGMTYSFVFVMCFMNGVCGCLWRIWFVVVYFVLV